MSAIVRDLFLPPDARSLPAQGDVPGAHLRLGDDDLAAPGWLLRAIQAQQDHGGAVQILMPNGAAVAFVLSPAASVALAEREPVQP